jgi:hypothetical protein
VFPLAVLAVSQAHTGLFASAPLALALDSPLRPLVLGSLVCTHFGGLLSICSKFSKYIFADILDLGGGPGVGNLLSPLVGSQQTQDTGASASLASEAERLAGEGWIANTAGGMTSPDGASQWGPRARSPFAVTNYRQSRQRALQQRGDRASSPFETARLLLRFAEVPGRAVGA